MFGSCRVCGRPLKSRTSAKKGIGPDCEKRLKAAELRIEKMKIEKERKEQEKKEGSVDNGDMY